MIEVEPTGTCSHEKTKKNDEASLEIHHSFKLHDFLQGIQGYWILNLNNTPSKNWKKGTVLHHSQGML